MIQLAVKAPIWAIMGASGLGAFFFAELTPTDYSTPGMIIAALFTFIGICAGVLYKVVLSPLFNVFIANLQTANEERSKFLEYSIAMNKSYAEHVASNTKNIGDLRKASASNTKVLKILMLYMSKQPGFKETLAEVTRGTTFTLSDETSVPGED